MVPPLAPPLTLALAGAATDILPLSSGGHLALASLLLGVDVQPAVSVAIGAGSWLACVIYLRRSGATTLRGLASLGRRVGTTGSRGTPWTDGERTAGSVLVATLSLVAVDGSLRTIVPVWGREPTLIGASLLLTAIALASTLWAPAGDWGAPTLLGAAMVGAVQGAAILPGLSSPAVGLASLLWLGVRRERAFELCFLIAIPASALLALTARPLATLRPLEGSALEAATLTALVAATCFLPLYALQRAVTRRLLPLFSVYLVPLAVATLAWGYARP